LCRFESVHVCWCPTTQIHRPLIYELLFNVNQSFDEILAGLERIQQHPWFRERRLIQTVELAVRETQAWTTFEILEVLHDDRREGHSQGFINAANN
jgi:hypothetical protein